MDTVEDFLLMLMLRAHGRGYRVVRGDWWLGTGCCCRCRGKGAMELSRRKELAGWAKCQGQVRYGDWLETSRV